MLTQIIRNFSFDMADFQLTNIKK